MPTNETDENFHKNNSTDVSEELDEESSINLAGVLVFIAIIVFILLIGIGCWCA